MQDHQNINKRHTAGCVICPNASPKIMMVMVTVMVVVTVIVVMVMIMVIIMVMVIMMLDNLKVSLILWLCLPAK